MHVNYSGNHLTYGGQTWRSTVQNQGQTGGQPVAQAPLAAPIAHPTTPTGQQTDLRIPRAPKKIARNFIQAHDLNEIKKELLF